MMILVNKKHLAYFPPGRTALVLLGMLVLLLSWPPAAQVQGKTGPSTESLRSEVSQAGTDSNNSGKSFRLREGTKIESRLGRFEHKSQSATFRTEDGLVFGSLPNLNLQRILETLKTADKPETMWWSVSGIVTEFGGKNHLLITRAVYKARVITPSSESVIP
ncbi:MAG: hypothetical protein RH917_10480 [Lacipirellulaceae bacterium]